ncbi:c-type cytochrome biogenesis protein CcmI [Microvirga makkahensis]|uniref:C-type cytochrome biogenesis protein CcmI n=1 Tax=Microvirga makkahensis TaxID=1128670 RepID=A0A7X3MV95_9HYPH|nr:c-type cytochrome biogenesis protein CcmI [Microvirga makkahensis]MXQ13854.1 c-type cytochrome biogenesis protein CcmI [Microvirga makkahensis]
MVIWIILLLMTAAAVMAVLWPLSRHRALTAEQLDPDTQFYREQIAEIERDRERGVLLASEAEAAKVEAGRRLLRSTGMTADTFAALGEPALRRRRAASALALSVIPIIALALYGAYGSPQLLTHPPKEQAEGQRGSLDLMTAVSQIEAHLAQNPQDGRGWEVVAPVYIRMGRIEDAVKAYEAAVRYLGPSPDRLANYGEVMVLAKDGLVSSEAQRVFEQAVALDSTSPKARYYLAVAAEQDGQFDKAKRAYGELLAASPEGAPWANVVRQRLEGLGAEQSVAGAQENAPQLGADDIARMVSGLAERLETRGGSPDEWARLIRSYAVLGQRDKAKAAVERARQVLAQDDDGVRTIDAMAREMKLIDAGP